MFSLNRTCYQNCFKGGYKKSQQVTINFKVTISSTKLVWKCFQLKQIQVLKTLDFVWLPEECSKSMPGLHAERGENKIRDKRNCRAYNMEK